MTPKIVKQLDLNLSTLECPLRITAARGEPEFSTLEVKKLKFEIQGKTYVWDFVLCELQEYDVILGMDWLGYNQAYLDCKKKRVLQGPCDSDV